MNFFVTLVHTSLEAEIDLNGWKDRFLPLGVIIHTFRYRN